jgi:CHAT domain-containing protein
LSSLPNTVALYTLVTPTRYRIIVVTGAKTVPPREYVIAEKELNRKIAQFKQVLSTPDNDPKPLATELYNILIGPVKKDLDEAHAKTLVWYFYGVLRYVPLAALYDPVAQQYLVQNYNNVTVTHQSLDYLAQKPDVGRLSAVAMGLARKYEENLPKLSSVVDELNGIVKDPRVSDSDGRIPGTILLDGQFTEKAMDGQLSSGPEVVHIASHFVFQSGDYNQSYLLLAGKDTDTGGYHMTVADFTNDPSLTLAHTDLLTLSACETGVTGNASNGYEVEGLSAVAQHKGAKAVISTLWEVNDSSTGDLMADFYKRWSAGEGDVSKIEALRQAQLDLLTGKVAPKPDYTGDPNAPTSYVHPYYWAPFVLMGNWR